MEKDKLLKNIDSVKFKRINGKILRIINMLEGEYTSLEIVYNILMNSIRLDEFHRSIVYLLKAAYIEIRNENTKERVSSEEISNKDCEATLTATGIRLAMGFAKDEAIEM